MTSDGTPIPTPDPVSTAPRREFSPKQWKKKKRFDKEPRGFFAPTEKGKIVHPISWWVEMHKITPFKEKLFWDTVRDARKYGRAALGIVKGLECWFVDDGWHEEL